MAPSGETRRLGVHSCSCVHLCPVCWARRRIQERAEIVYAGELWLAAGSGLATATLTVPHRAGEPLSVVSARLDSYADVFRKREGRQELRDLFGVEGVMRAVETTHGWVNGWHPHQHLLLWLTEPWDEPMQAGLREWWRRKREKWRKRHAPDSEPAYDDRFVNAPSVTPADLPKVGGHITKGPSRTTLDRYYEAEDLENWELADYLGGFVPEPLKRPRPSGPGMPQPGMPGPGPSMNRHLAAFEFGALAAAGDLRARALWDEYVEHVGGSHWLRWPIGFRERFGLGPAGKLAALEGDIVARLPGRIRPEPRKGGLVLERGSGGAGLGVGGGGVSGSTGGRG